MKRRLCSGFDCNVVPFIIVLAVTTGCQSLDPTSEHGDAARQAPERSLKNLPSLAENNPSDTGVCLAAARQLISVNRQEEAVRLLDHANVAQPRGILLLERARLCDDPKDRERYAREAIHREPDLCGAATEVIHALRQQGRHAEARALALTSQQREGMSPRYWWELAIAHSQAGDRNAALIAVSIASSQSYGAERDTPWWMEHFVADLYEGNPRWPAAANRIRAAKPIPPGDTTANHYPPLPAGVVDAPGCRPFDEQPAIGFILDYSATSGPYRAFTVAPGSIAELAGGHSDDRVLSIDGRAMNSGNDLLLWIDEKDVTQPTQITVDRNGTVLMLSARTVTVREHELTFRECYRRGARLTAEGQYLKAFQLYTQMSGTLFFYNAEMYSLYTAAGVSCNASEGVERVLDVLLKDAPANPDVLYLRAYAASASGKFDDALGFVRRAQNASPDSGMLVSYEGILFLNSGRANAEELAKERFDRAMLLGNGGWASTQLAGRLDGAENQRRAALRAERDRTNQAIAMGLLAAFTGVAISNGSSGSSFGSNPWRDYGYEAQAIHGYNPSWSNYHLQNTKWY
ncbi:MAG: hypothetical protein IT435_08635 [Phycisphaerales bacterium]|nr:hypothetical protein [Phycisphaerales bacterium]